MKTALMTKYAWSRWPEIAIFCMFMFLNYMYLSSHLDFKIG